MFTTILLATAPIAGVSALSHIPVSLDATLPVHKLRAAYELVQSKSWRLIEQQYLISGQLSDNAKAKIVKELFTYHHQYVADHLSKYERENKDHLQTVFPDFNHFYEWTHVQGHINATISLFDVFRLYLAETVENSVGAADQNGLGAKDFAETVLYDTKLQIAKAFEDIHLIMVGQGLYYKMAMVLMTYYNGSIAHTTLAKKEDPSSKLNWKNFHE